MRKTSTSKQPASKLPVSKLPGRKLLGAVIAATLFMPTSGFTLGLGEIEVNSALNQKLKADIELLSTTVDDSENIIVKLASRKAFTRAGLDRPYALNDLRFKAEVINGVPHIRVTSGSPIREPFLNFLVEVDWPNGHLLREYTVLLDPPVFMTQAASAAQVQQARSDSRPSSGTIYATPTAKAAAPVAQTSVYQPVQAVNQPQVKQPKVQAAPAVSQPAASQSVVRQPVQQQVIQQQVEAVWNPPAASEYRIKKGDTAWSLAEAMRPDQNVSVEQMMVAMLQHNPESFIDGNINGLRRGYILRVPDYDQITSVSKDSAKALVRNQAALWRQYQQTKNAGQLASAMEKSSSPSVDSRAANSQAVKKDDGYLEIVSAGTGASTASSKDPTEMTAAELRAELSLARERIETERVEKEGLQKKLSQLKATADEGMFSIEDDQLSDVQAMNLPADGAQAEAKLGDTLTELKETAETVVDDATKDMQDAAQSVVGDETTAANEMSGTEAATDADGALFVDETATQDGENQTAAEQVSADNAREVIPPQPVTTGVQSWIDKIMSNPVVAAAAGGGLLLLLGLFGWMFKRSKPEEETAVASGFDSLEDLAEEVAEEQVAESVEDEFDPDTTTSMDASDDEEADESNSTEAAATEESQETTGEDEPRDDVIAEADVYLAYGIYQQAEELLVQAISDNPDRNDYRLKLAEVHYASKNADAFVQTATEIKEKAGEDSSIWKKVLVMGQDLCSDNPMFQGSLIGGLDLDSVSPQTPEMDLDLGLDSTGDAETEVESIAEDVSEIELPEMESLADVETDADEVDTGELEPVEELEFDLSDTGAVEELDDSAGEEEFSLDIETSELDISDATDSDTDIDFGLDEAVEDVKAVDDITAEAPAVEETLLEEIDELDDEEISLDLTEDADVLNIAADGDVEEAVDISDIEESVDEVSMELNEAADSLDLDLDDDSIEIISDSAADDDDFDLSALDDVDEISTKLDLARAYLDMGDTEGTRSILEEVVAEGNDDQKDEANILMKKLG